MSLRRIRPAVAADHQAFVRLFPELEVDDPILDQAKFDRELVPTMIVVEAGEGAPEPDRVVGYSYFQIMKDLAYVRHIVTAPEVRRTGVGRALMAAVAERARAAGCTSWCLNVMRGNVAARALYESVGLAAAFDTKALHLDWACVDAAPEPDMRNTHVTARLIEPDDDALVETTLALVSGQLATKRAFGGRVLMGLFDGDTVVAGTVFDPTFPGAYPFRAARPDLAFALLRAIRRYARPSDLHVKVVSEDQPAIADALIAAGARVVHDIVNMKGALPAPEALSPLTADR